MRTPFPVLLSVLLLLAAPPVLAQPTDAPARSVDSELQDKLEQVIEGFDGDVGVYARHLPSGRTAALRADSVFPTASMIKVPILVKTFHAIENDTLDYHDTLTYRDSLYYPGVDLLGHFKDGAEVKLSKVVMLMMTMSDNTGSLWLQHLCGTGTAINDWLAAHGFEHTRMNSRTPGRKDDWRRYGWGQTTPREMARLLVMIHEGRAVSPAASAEMYRTLTRTYWDDEALSQIPPTVQVASKQGAVDESRSEVALVNAPNGPYVFSVITKNQADTSWTSDNAGFQLIRDVSRTLWQHFEPESDWQPAEGIRRYWGSTPE
jgi:beta-lactamase class A